MTIRNRIPDVWPLRLTVVLDGRSTLFAAEINLQDRTIQIHANTIERIVDRIPDFVESLGEICSHQMAYLKWDGSCDQMTEYQRIRIFPNYQLRGSYCYFSFELGTPMWMAIAQLDGQTIIRLDSVSED